MENVRYYNGPHTDLMDELYDLFEGRIDIDDIYDWGVMSLYLAKSCKILENNGWKKINNKKKYKIHITD